MIKAAVAILVFWLCANAAWASDQKTIDLYGWSDYISPEVLDEFTRDTGIGVAYDTYDSEASLEAGLLEGSAKYDVVIPSATVLERGIKADAYQKLDRSELSNWSNLWPSVMRRLAAYDPGNGYAVNYMWSTTEIAYNVDQVKQRLGDETIDGWDAIFKPQVMRKLAGCGVELLDSPEDVLSAALLYLGFNPDSKDADEIRRAADLVARIRPYVKRFDSSDYIGALANGDICLAMTRAGGGLQASERARGAGNGVDIASVLPKEGARMSLDNLAIPANAPHPQPAAEFINFLMRPDIAARDTDVTDFANGVLASEPLVNKNIIDNKSVYPTGAVMRRLYVVTPGSPLFQRFVAREWSIVKSGR